MAQTPNTKRGEEEIIPPPTTHDDPDPDMATTQAPAFAPPEPISTQPPAIAAAVNPNIFVVELKPIFADYLRRRAAAHGDTPARHMALLVQQFAAHHDEWRRQNAGGTARPGKPSVDRE